MDAKRAVAVSGMEAAFNTEAQHIGVKQFLKHFHAPVFFTKNNFNLTNSLGMKFIKVLYRVTLFFFIPPIFKH